ncbi:hypothetical protein ABZ464_44270 [Streptomyces sp. NPDC005820]|uniref:hypothetical protein n=1 Tax=Streptomyces sp. NPDC005820 TaxID=3157069 RepID=UPI00340353D8
MRHATITPARRSRTRRPGRHHPTAVRPSPAPATWTVMPLWQALALDTGGRS